MKKLFSAFGTLFVLLLLLNPYFLFSQTVTTIYTEGQGSAPQVLSTDLLQSKATLTASSGIFTNESTSNPAVLTDGVASFANSGKSAISSGSSLTYTLSGSSTGFDIKKIDIYSTWQDGGRLTPNVVVSYALKASPTVFTTLTTVTFSPTITYNSTGIWTKSSISIVGLEAVSALKFDFPNQQNGYVGYNEIDVAGVANGVDTEAPTVPVNLTSNLVTSSTATLSWSPSTDNNEVTAYEIYLGTNLVATTANTTYTITGLTPATEYSFTIKAKDALNNTSAASAALVVTTTPIDNVAPTVPQSLSATAITPTTIVLSWQASTDNLVVLKYNIYQNGILIGTSSVNTYTVTGLSQSKKYAFAVSASDAEGNVSNVCPTAEFTTSSLSVYTGFDGTLNSGNGWTSNWTDTGGLNDMTSTINSTGLSFGALNVNGGSKTCSNEMTRNFSPISISDGDSLCFSYLLTENAKYYEFRILSDARIDSKSGHEEVYGYHNINGSGWVGTYTSKSCVPYGTTTFNLIVLVRKGSSYEAKRFVYADAAKLPLRMPAIGDVNAFYSGSYTSPALADITNIKGIQLKEHWADPGANTIDEIRVGHSYAEVALRNLPSAPTNLSVSDLRQSSFTLSWALNPVDVGAVEQCEVFKDGVSLGNVSGTSMKITGLTPATTYNFTVKAKIGTNIISAPSIVLAVTTTPADVVAPSVPQNLNYTNLTQSSFVLNWDASTDNVELAGYEVFKNNVSVGTTTSTNMKISGLSPSTSYSMTVKAIDAVGNISTSAALSVLTTDPDLIAPTQPTNFEATVVTQTSVTLTWTPSTDNVGVELYQIFCNGALINSSTTNTITISGLSSSTDYVFTVKAKDLAGNTSIASEEVAVTTSEFVLSPFGYIENFNDDVLTDWYTGAYRLYEQNKMLKIIPAKANVWDGFGFRIPTVDITAKPYISLKIKSNIDFNLAVAIGKVGGKIDNYPLRLNTIGFTGAQEIVASNEFQEYSLDYTGYDAATLSDVNNIHFVLNPLTRQFGDLPNKEIYFEDIKIGEIAVCTPSISAIPDQIFTTKAQGNESLTVKFRNVTDGTSGENPITIRAVSSNPACIPDPVVTYVSPQQYGSIELKPDVTTVGESTISVIVSAPNTSDKTMNFKVKVVPNSAPVMRSLPNIVLKKGEKKVIELNDVFDGNGESVQKLKITASASTPAYFTDLSVKYDSVAIKGALTVTPSLTVPSGTTETIQVKLKDNGGVINGGIDESIYTFNATIYDDINNKPTLDSIPSKAIKAIKGESSIMLTGVSTGDKTAQTLTIDASVSQNSILTDLVVGNLVDGKVPLNFNLTGETGTAVVTVRISDNGGLPSNNGNEFIEHSFVITAVPVPVTGIIADYTQFIGKSTGGLSTSQSNGMVEILSDGTVHFKGTVLQQTFPANWFDLRELTGGKDLDISNAKRVSFKVKCLSTNKYEAPAGVPFDSTTILFRLVDHEIPGQASSGYNISYKKVMVKNDDLWHDVYLDFSGLFYKDANGGQTDSTRITKLMLDINCTWFQQVSGDYYFKDLKLGDYAELPKTVPHATVGMVADQVFYKGEKSNPIKLTGISDGAGNQTAVLSASANNTNLISNIEVGSIVNGTAQLNYSLVPDVADSAIVTVIAKNITSIVSVPDTMSFKVYVVDTTSISNNFINIDLNKKFQTVQGVGTFLRNDLDLNDQIKSINDLNITVMRFTTSSEFEPVNDNSNPEITDYSKYNRNALPLEAIKRINDETNCHKFFYTSWTPANWMKQNKGEYPDPSVLWAGNNKLKSEMISEFAEYLVAICKTVKDETGVELYGISIQNEPTFNEPYSSCQVSGNEFKEIVKVLGPRLAAENLSTRIIMPEDIATQLIWVTEKINPVLADPIAKDYIGIMAVHLYDADGINVGGTGSSRWKELLDVKKSTVAEGLWMTETSGFSNVWEGQWTKDYMSGRDQFNPGPLDFAGSMYTAFKVGEISGWTDFDGAIHKTDNDLYGSVFKNYSKFLQSGAVMVEATSTNASILSLTFKNPDNSLVNVLLNTSRSPKKVTLSGANVPKVYRFFSTKNYEPFKELATVTKGSVVLAPRSVSTLYYSTANLAPTIDPANNVAMILGNPDSTITVTGISYGADQVAQNISTVEVSSTNPGVATANVVYTANNATAKIQIHPLNYGTTQFIVKVKDDGGVANGGIDSTLMKFFVQVTSKMNNSPTMELPADLVINENADSTRLTINGVSDGDGYTQQLSFTVSSSNQGIITGGRIEYTQGSSIAKLIFKSLPNMNGSTELTVIATDNGGDDYNNGNLFAKIVVPVTVRALNGAPIMTTTLSNEIVKVGVANKYLINYEDGDPELTQTVSYSIRNSNPTVLGASLAGLQTGVVRLTLTGKVAGTSTVTVIFKDNGGTLYGGVDSLATSYFITVEPVNAISTVKDNLLTLSPNPVKEFMVVNLASDKPEYYFISDISGQVVDKNNIVDDNGKFTINTSGLPCGMYFITVKSGNNNRTIKFIKQ